MSSKIIFAHLKKDILLEIRQQYSFYGIILYTLATVFVLYNSIKEPEPQVWSGLFWVIQLFICINAVAKSFLNEKKERMLYMYSVTHPVQFIVAKFIFNSLLIVIMSLLSIFLYSLFMGFPIKQSGLFILVVITGSWSLSMVFTFLSAIAAKAQQNAAILVILGFPILLPQLFLIYQLTESLLSTGKSFPLVPFFMLLSLDLLVFLLAVILFPFLWKD
ncbi:MAG: heme exporter protein CcmB [Chitinophagaceae bacterium]|nr:heme exporter protein CcmB [Chitinophagaceae bacterium]